MDIINKNEEELLSEPFRFYDPERIQFTYEFNEYSGDIVLKTGYRPCFEDFSNVYNHEITRLLSCRLIRNHQDNKAGNKKASSSGRIKNKCIILIHGFLSKNKNIYQQLAERYSRRGLDCVLYSLPFHFERTDEHSYEVAAFINTGDLRVTFELFRQSVIELQLLIRVLKMIGYEMVGALGFSFGGYCCSILACICREVDFIIPLATIGNFSNLLIFKKGKSRLDENNERHRINKYLAENFIKLISPIYFKPLIDSRKILLIQGVFDHRAPLADVVKMRKEWGFPDVLWYPCGHFTFFLFNRLTLKLTYDFINKMEEK